jgi:hypothetical protein
LFGALLFGASFLIAGCTDLPTGPDMDAPDEVTSYGLLSSIGSIVGGKSRSQVTVLERRVPLAHDEVVTRTIGRWGGVIHLPEAGLTMTFPWGAVKQATEITVTAPAGNLVGYLFGPHGTEFDRPVVMLQDMTKTKGLGWGGLSVAYFDGDLEPTVTALERIVMRLLGGIGIFRIEHFCGYVIATN